MAFKNKFIKSVSLIIFFSLCFTHPAGTEENILSFKEPPTYKNVLDNGLVCLVKEYPDSGLVAVNLRINSGSITEGKFLGYGISHLIEHLAFKSTQKYSLGQIENQVKNFGGKMNATTSLDTTTFFITAPSGNLLKVLDILKEMLFNANFPEKEFQDEKQVILKEMILHEDNPQRKLSKLLWTTAYQVHPYKHPVIGYPENFKSLKRDDVLKYYNSKAMPNNMVIAIVGDVENKKALALVKEYFGKTRLPNYSEIVLPKEPEQISARHTVDKTDISLARIALGFHSTELLHKDLFALDVLAVILGQGDASRLHRTLVKELQLVRSISSFNYTPKYKGLFTITAVLEPANINKVKAIILHELSSLKKRPPGKKELLRAKNLIVSDRIYSQQSLEAICASLSLQEIMTGDYDFDKKYIKRIKAVTAAQITGVANKYFGENKLNFIELLPKNFKTDKAKVAEKLEVPSLNLTRNITLKNGIKLIAIKNSKTPTGYISIAFLGGLRAETFKKNGLSAITSKMLLKGTKTRNESKIKSAFEAKGANVSSFSGKNSFGLTTKFLKKDLNFVLKMLNDILLNPKFSPKELAKVKRLALLDVRLEDDNIFIKGFNALRRLIYKAHPYALKNKGTQESIQNISWEDVVNFYEKFVVTSNMVVSLCGDFEPDFALEKLKKTFKDFKPSSNPKIIKAKPVQALTAMEKLDLTMDKKETLILWGFSGISLKSKERFAFRVLASIMSGANGRLFHSIRDREGLSYTQNFFFNPQYDEGSFGIYVATSPQKAKKAAAALLEQLKLLTDKGISNQEIKQAQTELIARHRMNAQYNSFISLQTALNALYGIGLKEVFEYEKNIKMLSKKDVENIISKYIKSKPYAVVTVSPKKNN
ncbi:MAG: insulinase family protein [Omnitrophica bacterium]|nr:insulinase family protein [Candidatus Omnitrophota bacterium]